MSSNYIRQHNILETTLAKAAIASGVLLLFVVTFGVLYLIEHEGRMSNLSQKNYEDQQEQTYADLIRELGAIQAYAEFKATATEMSEAQQHENAHIFGEVLYYEKGVDGISACDNSFNFGCYHSFLGRAIHEEGLEIVEYLHNRCIEDLNGQALGCHHGIGHGIATYLGYTEEDLVRALEVCSSLPHSDPIGGCNGGVFMEYSFQTMLDTDAQLRAFDSENPYTPCDSLNSQFQPACYYWQSQWWGAVLEGDAYEKYSQIGSYCSEVTGDDLRDQCYIGAGNVSGDFVGYDIEEAKALCSSVGSIDAQILCRAGAASSYRAIPRVRDQANEICTGLSKEQEERCVRIAQLPR